VLKARDEFAGSRAECPTCGQIVQIPQSATGGAPVTPEPGRAEPTSVHNFLDPPSGVLEQPDWSRVAGPATASGASAGSSTFSGFGATSNASATAAAPSAASAMQPTLPVLRRMF
jgi:hypothetical protein